MANTSQPAFCTIVTQSHLDYALALYYSYSRFETEIPFYVLVSDSKKEDRFAWDKYPNITVLALEEIGHIEKVGSVVDKYHADPDFMRWSLKPALMLYLLQDIGFEEVVFLDCDLCFYHEFSYIREQLTGASIVLSPHWRSRDPLKLANNFRLNFTEGMYNGGFVGASQNGIEALQWWLAACLYRCERTQEEGFYVDQKYLDMMPAQFPGTKVLYHRGCNVANWNLSQSIRTKNGEGQTMILDKWPIIFIHFSGMTVRGILKGQDPLLNTHFIYWKNALDQAAIFLGREQRSFAVDDVPSSLPKRILNKLGFQSQ